MADHGEHYLIIKRGLYYAPNSQGYTGIRDKAGRYTLDFAKDLYTGTNGECRWVHEDRAKEFMPAAYPDLVIDHLIEQRDALRAQLAAMQVRP